MKKLLKNGALLMSSQVTSKLINGVTFFMLAGMLSPSDFGIIAVCWIFIMIGEAFFDLGISNAMVREGREGEKNASTVFWALCCLGVLWALFIFSASVIIQRLYPDSLVPSYLAWMSILFIVKPYSVVTGAILAINHRFDQTAKLEIISSILGAGVALYCAFKGFGAWSLVVKALVSSVALVMASMYITRWSAAKKFEWPVLLDYLKFGLPVIVSTNASWVIESQVEKMVVGYYFGVHSLGLVEFAKKPVQLGSQLLDYLIKNYTFPLISHRNNKVERRCLASRFISIYVIVGVFMASAIFLFSQIFVESIWGDRWLESISLMGIYSITLVSGAVVGVLISIMSANVRIKHLLSITLGGSVCVSGLLFAGSIISLEGVAYGYAIGVACTGAILLRYVIVERLLEIRCLWRP